MILIDVMKKISNNFEELSYNEKEIFLINIKVKKKNVSNVEIYKYDICDNIYLNAQSMLILNKIYIKAKKIINTIVNFIKKYKYKKYIKYDCNVDLYFNEFKIFKPEQLIKLTHNKTIYTFRIANLLSMWKDALYNCDLLFPKPKRIKNPYTNIEFKKNHLIHIYNSAVNAKFIIPSIITVFYKTYLSIIEFTSVYYTILKENSIEQFILNGSNYEKFEHIENMFYYFAEDINCVTIKERLSSSEKREIISKLTYILNHYLVGRYSCNPIKKSTHINLAKNNIKDFLKDNSLFCINFCSGPIHNDLSNSDIEYIPPAPTISPPPPPVLTTTSNISLPSISLPSPISISSISESTSLPRIELPQINGQTSFTNTLTRMPIVNNYSSNNLITNRRRRRRRYRQLSIINERYLNPFNPNHELPRTPT